MADKETVVVDNHEPREPRSTRMGVGTGIIAALLIVVVLFLLLGGLRPLMNGSSTNTPTTTPTSSATQTPNTTR